MASKFAVWVNDANTDVCVWKCTSCGHVVEAEGRPLENGMDHCPACGAKMMGEVRE